MMILHKVKEGHLYSLLLYGTGSKPPGEWKLFAKDSTNQVLHCPDICQGTKEDAPLWYGEMELNAANYRTGSLLCKFCSGDEPRGRNVAFDSALNDNTDRTTASPRSSQNSYRVPGVSYT